MDFCKYYKEILFPMFMKPGKTKKKYRKYKKYFRDLDFSIGNTPDVYTIVHYKKFEKDTYKKIRKRAVFKQHLKEMKNPNKK